MARIISAHAYHSVWPLDQQVECRHRLHQALKTANPELGYWQSEYCILQRNAEIRGGGRRDLGMNTALYVARIIHEEQRCHLGLDQAAGIYTTSLNTNLERSVQRASNILVPARAVATLCLGAS